MTEEYIMSEAYYVDGSPNYNSVANFLKQHFSAGGFGIAPNETLYDIYGTESKTGSATVWEDMHFSLTSSKLGANAKPDVDYTNVGLLFPQNSTAEIVYFVGQMPHQWKAGSLIYPHIHWQQMNTNVVVWKLSYKLLELGAAVPTNFTTIATTTNVFPYVSGNLNQISAFPPITMTGHTISTVLLMKLYREDNVDAGAGTGDALAFQYDIHYEIDSQGSNSEYTK